MNRGSPPSFVRGSAPIHEGAQRILDLGCGRQPAPGAIGVDAVALPGVQIVARLEARGLPIRRGSVEAVIARHVLEHVEDLPAAMNEIWEALQPGGRCLIEVPYFTSVSAFADPTHRRWFTFSTFEHFATQPQSGWQANRHVWFGTARFEILSRRMHFGRAHALLGIEALANRWPAVYENFLAYWFPARVLSVELRRSADS